jgi:hypothetical protein
MHQVDIDTIKGEITMRFMMMVKNNGAAEGTPPPPGLIAAIGVLTEKMTKAGVLVQTGGLQPSSNGAKIRVSKGGMSVVDGPFAETKELIGGFAILDVPSKEEAVRVGTEFMQVHIDILGKSYEGTLEIRAMFDPANAPCGSSHARHRESASNFEAHAAAT